MKDIDIKMTKRKILLFYDNTDLDRQVLKPVDYLAFESEWNRQGGGNSGNKLFTSAAEQYLMKEDIEYGYYTGEEREETINEKYDLIVIPMANMFNANPGVVNQLNEYTKLIESFKIPVYILGCGIQCDSYDDIGQLVSNIRKPVERFLKAVYRTGGELALRGYATKEFLDRVMPNTAVVTGCPSFYQRGSGLQISNDKVSEEEFKAALNGNLKYLKQIGMLSAFDRYPNSIYVDQDEFAQILYFRSRSKEDAVLQLIRKKTLTGVRLLAEDRVKLFYDIPVWMDYFVKEGINFSCGTRIHGNIMATLSGVPAKVIYRDARTRELAEFFELPHAEKWNEEQSLYEAYLESDYTAFNKGFPEKFKAFEAFMTEHGISHDLEDRSLYEEKIGQYQWNVPQIIGQTKIDSLKVHWKRHEKFYRNYDKIIESARRMAGRV